MWVCGRDVGESGEGAEAEGRKGGGRGEVGGWSVRPPEDLHQGTNKNLATVSNVPRKCGPEGGLAQLPVPFVLGLK